MNPENKRIVWFAIGAVSIFLLVQFFLASTGLVFGGLSTTTDDGKVGSPVSMMAVTALEWAISAVVAVGFFVATQAKALYYRVRGIPAPVHQDARRLHEAAGGRASAPVSFSSSTANNGGHDVDAVQEARAAIQPRKSARELINDMRVQTMSREERKKWYSILSSAIKEQDASATVEACTELAGTNYFEGHPFDPSTVQEELRITKEKLRDSQAQVDDLLKQVSELQGGGE